MSLRLEQKVALITGAARGQGEAEARRFVAEGARVAITDILDDLGEALTKELGDATFYQRLDVTNLQDCSRAVGAALDRFGALHILVNNAGIGAVGALDETSLEWIAAEHLAIERDLCVVVADVDGDEARGGMLIDDGKPGKGAGLPDAGSAITAWWPRSSIAIAG
jgi:short-subunit dehydrogenase involved in D-alanine esterification of teichoic acids